jgi:hypothetical protein
VNDPDELMIDWGNTPPGSTAYIYWPQVMASDVLQLASALYSTHLLSVADPNTIQCKVVNGATYIPIPSAAGKTFAGLLTVDLPMGVTAGQVFKIVVRRISTKTVGRENIASVAVPSGPNLSGFRYITGAFQIEIPVTTENVMLLPEENTLAILKWRLQNMSPVYRWHPVLKRYIDYVSARVDGSGGNANAISPSSQGVPVKGTTGGSASAGGHTGKIAGLIFDRFGDFAGFVLDTEDGERKFFSREKEMANLAERAWRERLCITVLAEHHEPHRPRTIIVREPPAPFWHELKQ